jgi:hypothetical protein
MYEIVYLDLLEGHLKEVNNTFWDDENKILLTSGADKRFKVDKF